MERKPKEEGSGLGQLSKVQVKQGTQAVEEEVYVDDFCMNCPSENEVLGKDMPIPSAPTQCLRYYVETGACVFQVNVTDMQNLWAIYRNSTGQKHCSRDLLILLTTISLFISV